MDKSGATCLTPAPSLEALRTVFSLAMKRFCTHQAIWDPKSHQIMQSSFIDVRRAYFSDKIDRGSDLSFVELPPEDPDRDKLCREFLRHMYGTRPAADGWQE